MTGLVVKIDLFDDGNERFSKWTNEWLVTKQMFNGGKYSLKNIANPDVILRSISSWKTRRIERQVADGEETTGEERVPISLTPVP
jgi:hypothetical protein